MKLLILPTAILFFVSCSQESKLCDCVEAGKKVNELSASFFNRTYSDLGKDSLDNAIQRRDLICEEFQEMSAEKLMQAKDDCEGLVIQK